MSNFHLNRLNLTPIHLGLVSINDTEGCQANECHGKTFSTAASQNQMSLSLGLNNIPTAAESNCSMNDAALSTARSCESLFNTINIPDAISSRERKIHGFLDFMNIDQINVTEFLEATAKIESPNVQKLFQEKGNVPNLKDRRKLAARNQNRPFLGGTDENVSEQPEIAFQRGQKFSLNLVKVDNGNDDQFS